MLLATCGGRESWLWGLESERLGTAPPPPPPAAALGRADRCTSPRQHNRADCVVRAQVSWHGGRVAGEQDRLPPLSLSCACMSEGEKPSLYLLLARALLLRIGGDHGLCPASGTNQTEKTLNIIK